VRNHRARASRATLGRTSSSIEAVSGLPSHLRLNLESHAPARNASNDVAGQGNPICTWHWLFTGALPGVLRVTLDDLLRDGEITTMSAKSRVVGRNTRSVLAVLCTVAIGPGEVLASGLSPWVAVPQEVSSQDVAQHTAAPPIPADQLDSLVAPIALYPDPLLAQTLAASTYPLEIMQLQQWLAKNPGLKDKALADAVARQPWDPSIQAMAVLPDVVNRLANDIQWSTDLGNAFLAQQSDVMDAVQRMRQKAQGTGSLKSTQQQVVETKVIEEKTVIVIDQATPEVVYVPSYDPLSVYGPPVYPYPPIYYAPPGYYAAGMAVSFGVGVAMGAFWGGGGGWGWGAGWGHNDITINNNNNFVRNSNIRGGNRVANNTWQHRPEHRGGTPYRDRTTADKFGGTARGDSLANRQSGARQQVDRQGGNLSSSRPGVTGTSGRVGQGDGGAAERAGSRAGNTDISQRASGGGADRVGQRDVSRSGGGGDPSAFGGGSKGFNGSSARESSNRGSSSMGAQRGSASRGGGGGGGGGRRGGGGGRR
jgi:Protein of unknown function (DUF3300)